MDNMEASYVFYVKVGTFMHLEHSKNCILTVNNTGIVKPTIQHDLIACLSVM